jgi:hypothetical protein
MVYRESRHEPQRTRIDGRLGTHPGLAGREKRRFIFAATLLEKVNNPFSRTSMFLTTTWPRTSISPNLCGLSDFLFDRGFFCARDLCIQSTHRFADLRQPPCGPALFYGSLI